MSLKAGAFKTVTPLTLTVLVCLSIFASSAFSGDPEKAKVHFNTVHAIERGKSAGKPETLKAIRKVLEKAGIQFTNGSRPGVRFLKLSRK